MSGCFHFRVWPNEGWLDKGRPAYLASISFPTLKVDCWHDEYQDLSTYRPMGGGSSCLVLITFWRKNIWNSYKRQTCGPLANIFHLQNKCNCFCKPFSDLVNLAQRVCETLDPRVTFTIFAIERLCKVSFQICQPLFLSTNTASPNSMTMKLILLFKQSNKYHIIMNAWISNRQLLSSWWFQLNWKRLFKLGIFPKLGMEINIFATT